MAEVSLKCKYCGKKFKRNKGEHNRNQKLERKVFCSLSCTSKQNHIDRPSKGYPQAFVGHYGNRKDEYSPFKKYLRSARTRSKTGAKRKVGITLQDLKDQWESQKGTCPFTGWKLVLPITSSRWPDPCEEKDKASIDRIDNNLGYVKGNVQFIAQMANWAKNRFKKDDVIVFCKAVAAHHK